MKSVIKISFVLFGLIFISGCNDADNEINKKTTSELYSEKTTKLLNDITDENTSFFYCQNIVEPRKGEKTFDAQEFLTDEEFKQVIFEKLNLQKESDYDSIIGFSEELIIDEKLLRKDLNVVLRKEFDIIFSYGSSEKARVNFYEKYPDLFFMSKPIFNKEYNIAVIDFGIGGCLATTPFVVRLIDGRWEFD
ncbi:MAG: hypothetical protein ACSHW7_08870 [Patiriisocius sp.]|uniref:hypothetical protein n=1 Tax=Patiriisocius sp. TaxID=2822396 RepID=UPI003EF490A1